MTSTTAASVTVAPPVIDVRSLSKSYARRPVLTDVSLAVPPGAVLGLLGKNGAGKTTLLKSLLGIVRPDSAAAFLLGENAWSLSPTVKSSIGYVPQSVTHPAWMSVAQVVEYTASFYPRWNDRLVGQLLAEWSVDESQKAALSLGTQQKLAIILALGHEPAVLILDEPAASLDPAARRDFLKALLDIAAAGHRTILFSTHITSDLERVADSVAILRQGRLIFHGPLDELKDSVKRLHLTSPTPLPGTLYIPGATHVRVDGHAATITVPTLDDRLVAELERAHNGQVRVEHLNLEDIFLEMHHG